MPKQVAVVFVQPGPYDETYAYSAIRYCRNRGLFPGYVVHGDWRAVELLLAKRLAQTVVVGRIEYSRPGAVTSKIRTNQPRFEKAPGRQQANSRTPGQTSAQRLLEVTAQRWDREFQAWMFPYPPN